MLAQDLAAFRTALRQQNGLYPAEDRRQDPRYTPVGPLARASVRLGQLSVPVDADVVDLSLNGLRLAVPPQVMPEPGMSCKIQLTPDGTRMLQLQGQIRWVERHALITVFGVQLGSAV
jgi:hypothetical protein